MIKTVSYFVIVKVATSNEDLASSKDIQSPVGEGRLHRLSRGFLFLRLYALESLRINLVASSTKEQKSLFNRLIRHAIKYAMLIRINLLNLFQGLTCKPVREPKLYYTVTSFDAIGRVSQSPVGGRG